jgi:hypothetical protein
MSVQIKIDRQGGSVVFTPAGQVAQSDLVFWFNGDTQPHFPIPGCGSLRVKPGGTTPAYQPFPSYEIQPTGAVTFSYGCALHTGESGSVSVIGDPAPPAPPPPGINPRTVPINISRAGGSVAFDTVNVAQADTVAWTNHDSVDHWPVPNCSGLLVQPGKTSNPVQLATSDFPRSATAAGTSLLAGPPALPMAITYGCAIPGHESESGTINVYDNLAALPSLQDQDLDGGYWKAVPLPTITTAGLQFALVSGGMSPYTIVQDPAYPQIELVETDPPGSSSGVSMVLAKKGSLPNGTITLQVNVTDALGRTLTAGRQIAIQEG